MRYRGVLTVIWRVLGGSLVSTLLLTGCASLSLERSADAFPPRSVMENGDYSGFLIENRQRLERCAGDAGCAEALFNLGFVHAYPQSPYYNPAQALQHFDALAQKYPRTSWAFAARAWSALLHEHLALDAKRRRLQTDLRTKEGTIRSLRGRIDRSRDLDIELDKKERKLLR